MPNTVHMVYEFVKKLTFIPSSSLGFGFAYTSNDKTYKGENVAIIIQQLCQHGIGHGGQ